MNKITNKQARTFVCECKPFLANNLSAIQVKDLYIVYSYGYWPLYVWDSKTCVWYENEERYSVTTSKHRTQARPLANTVEVSRGHLNAIIGAN
jgi:hypothetical protein